MILLKTPFHANCELTATSLPFTLGLDDIGLGKFVICDRCVAANSGDPGGVSLRIRDSSTWRRGSKRSLSFKCSGVKRSQEPEGGEEVDGEVVGREGAKEDG